MTYALVDALGYVKETVTKPYAHLVIPQGWRMIPCNEPVHDPELFSANPIEPVDHTAGEVSFTITPRSPEITQSVLLKRKTNVIQKHLDLKAKELGYDSILSASSYKGSLHPRFGPEGNAYFKWRDDCWDYGYQVLDEVLAGTRELPTDDDLLAGMPLLEV